MVDSKTLTSPHFPQAWSQRGIFVMLLLLLGGLYLFPARTGLHTQLYVFFFLPVIVFLALQLARRRLRLLALDYLMLVFLGTYAMSAFYPGAVVADKHFLYAATVLVAYLGLSRLALQHDPHMQALLGTLVVVVAISCLAQLYVFYSPPTTPLVRRLCCVMSTKNPLLEAQAIGFYMALGIYCLQSSRHWPQRLLFAGCLIALFTFGFFTYSRSFFIATVFLLGWFALIRTRSVYQVLALVAVSIVMVLVLAMFVMSDRGFSRLDIWHEAIKLIQQKPWLGYGSGYELDIRIVYEGDPNHWISKRHWFDTHNILLMLWLRYGLASVLAFCALLAGLLRCGLRYRHDNVLQALCAALLFGVASLCFDGGDIFAKVNSKWPALWFPVSLIAYRVHWLRRNARIT